MPGVSMCLQFADAIQRKYPMEQWHVAMKDVPPECKQEVRLYLRDMADRVRLAAETKARLTQSFGALKK